MTFVECTINCNTHLYLSHTITAQASSLHCTSSPLLIENQQPMASKKLLTLLKPLCRQHSNNTQAAASSHLTSFVLNRTSCNSFGVTTDTWLSNLTKDRAHAFSIECSIFCWGCSEHLENWRNYKIIRIQAAKMRMTGIHYVLLATISSQS